MLTPMLSVLCLMDPRSLGDRRGPCSNAKQATRQGKSSDAGLEGKALDVPFRGDVAAWIGEHLRLLHANSELT